MRREFGTIIRIGKHTYIFAEFFTDGEKWFAVGTTDENILNEHGIESPFNKSITNVIEDFARKAYSLLNNYRKEFNKPEVPLDKFYVLEYWPPEKNEIGRTEEEYYLVKFENKDTFSSPSWELVYEGRNGKTEKKERVLEKIFGKRKRPKP